MFYLILATMKITFKNKHVFALANELCEAREALDGYLNDLNEAMAGENEREILDAEIMVALYQSRVDFIESSLKELSKVN
jgi:hypothetical protein